jgi:hypothetical protein
MSPTELTYPLNAKTTTHHEVATLLFDLWGSVEALKQCEFYFRRYPFAGLPVSRDDHFRNVCEMYFGWFYMIRERIKKYLNKLNAINDDHVDVGRFLKAYDREFDQELRARNSVHHSGPFEDLSIDRLRLTRLMSMGKTDRRSDWASEHDRAYRAATKEWALRVKRRARVVDVFIDAVAKATLERTAFLAHPIDLTPDLAQG